MDPPRKRKGFIMPLILLIAVCYFAPDYFGRYGEMVCVFSWIIGSVALGQLAPNTVSGKICNWFWMLLGIFTTIFAVANHFSDTPGEDDDE